MPAKGVPFRGHRADRRSTRMIAEAEKLGGPLRITQGCYANGSLSAGTHTGGGVFDFSVRGLSLTQINRRVKALRRVGFAAWHRVPSEGGWVAHIHAVAIGCPDLSPSAERQVAAYKRGRNGLRSNKLDRHRGMGIDPITWEQYQKARPRPVDASAVARRAKRTGRYEGRVAQALRAEGFSANRQGYARWQRRLGYSGNDANGIAGLVSLRKLGRKHGFAVKA
jgi:hypothetical protein